MNDENGFLVVRLEDGAITNRIGDLGAAARKAGLDELDRCLSAFKLSGKRLITSIDPGRLEELERRPGNGARKKSLSTYWRLDARHVQAPLDELESAFQRLPAVDLVYREKTVTDPVIPNDPLVGSQGFLKAAPTGVGARWVWTQPNGDGTGMHFVDLEQGWLRGHEDLPPYTLVYGDNQDGVDGYVGNHGAAVLGIVAGVDNDKGVIGLAPQASVRVTSWNRTKGPMHVADALMAAVESTPRPHVVLLEVQIGSTPHLPAETDPATFAAIQCAVARGIVVVEAAGNSKFNLDTWVDSKGRRRLDRGSADFMDSGAIMVGAGLSDLPHDRWFWSNHGSRIDCYAWGDSIVTAGNYGSPSGGANDSYTQVFDGTSGASAIIAGCVLLLQGIHLASIGALLQPWEMRALLSDPSTGTPQGSGREGNIGVMPDLEAIVRNKLGIPRRAA